MKKPNLFSRFFRLLFLWAIIVIVLLNVNITLTYNAKEVKKTIWDKAKKVVEIVKPLIK